MVEIRRVVPFVPVEKVAGQAYPVGFGLMAPIHLSQHRFSECGVSPIHIAETGGRNKQDRYRQVFRCTLDLILNILAREVDKVALVRPGARSC